MTTVAEVRLWGSRIGAVSLGAGEEYAEFQYDPDFVRSGIQLAPLTMPLSNAVQRFPELELSAFHGLPGLLSDSLPDKFGNALIDAWLATQGRSASSFNAVERLCYTGVRGMGALEFEPSRGPRAHETTEVQVDRLVELASRVLSGQSWTAELAPADQAGGLADILRVGTSAGGARAKAVIAWNPATNEVRSGQLDVPAGFEHWLLKFDGVRGNRDKELSDPAGYGAIEYAYHQMAVAAGIDMRPCRLFEEGGRRHFMTRRFDRTDAGKKIHMQSLGALAHFSFNQAGAHGYEQALQTVRALGLSMDDVEQQYLRMVFNIVARNQDDHVKNIAFLMDRSGTWHLAPAFDVTYSFNPSGAWTAQHQMTLNGKRDHFEVADFKACAAALSMPRGKALELLERVAQTVRRWPEFAAEAGVAEHWVAHIESNLRLDLLSA